ncbi:MAG TPA: cytochrome c peroxidase [Gemmatimonadales bacterium]|nr:cytochrome c peroxidase [Gemmatimonadales bacterium]
MRIHAAIGALAVCACLIGLSGCSDEATAPPKTPDMAKAGINALAAEVRVLTAGRGITALEPAPVVRPALVRLGQALAFDKILSGNRDIACMTCHLPALGTGDFRSLSIGQGATGLGASRVHPEGLFIPRNAPPLFNLHENKPMFWDGRIFQDDAGTFHTPAGLGITSAMAAVFEFGTISMLPMFPVLSREEMRAFQGNELAVISDTEPGQAWQAIMARLGNLPEYRKLFEQAYPGQRFDGMTFAHASNAMAGFLLSKLAFSNTPWDRFLAGDDEAMTTVQLQGAKTFMNSRCAGCHNGPALTDNKFHNVAVAQFGPGQGDGLSGRDDFGRMRVTGIAADRYAFRTPPLRNVELTAPYGHDGAFFSLREFVAHYSESTLKLQNYDITQLEPLLQGTVVNNFEDILATRDGALRTLVFSEQAADDMTEFMKALTDPRARLLIGVIPGRVPSGLSIDGQPGSR